ncbi:hypothetical protein C7J99_12715 [Brevibacillus brevis]|nr:hypothetical protein C7J99_12715 [Brevibacillus brevis]
MAFKKVPMNQQSWREEKAQISQTLTTPTQSELPKGDPKRTVLFLLLPYVDSNQGLLNHTARFHPINTLPARRKALLVLRHHIICR